MRHAFPATWENSLHFGGSLRPAVHQIQSLPRPFNPNLTGRHVRPCLHLKHLCAASINSVGSNAGLAIPRGSDIMKSIILRISTLAVVFLLIPLAWAEKGGNKNRGNERWYPGEQAYAYGYHYNNTHGLPPGLAKRDRLPPGLQKHLWKHGSLPPGLQKKIGPVPMYYAPYYDRPLPPAYYCVPKRPKVKILLEF